MNCTSFKKYVGAFADGELDTKLTLEALEHLNMCLTCAHRVEDIHQMKAALSRVWDTRPAPPHLRSRVADAIKAEDAAAKPSPITRAIRIWFPLAAAAVMVLSVTVWQYRQTTDRGSGLSTVDAAPVAIAARTRHRECIVHALDAHCPIPSKDVVEVAAHFSKQLRLEVIAPDLSAAGFELVGADTCGVGDRTGAHVLYRSVDDGIMLSVFSVGRLSGLKPSERFAGRQRGYYVSTGDSLTVVVWHEGPGTYIICADLPADRIVEMVEPRPVSGG